MGQSLQRMEKKKLKTVILVILYFIVSRPHLHFNLLAFLHFFCILVLWRTFRSPLRIYFHSRAVLFSFVKGYWLIPKERENVFTLSCRSQLYYYWNYSVSMICPLESTSTTRKKDRHSFIIVKTMGLPQWNAFNLL